MILPGLHCPQQGTVGACGHSSNPTTDGLLVYAAPVFPFQQLNAKDNEQFPLFLKGPWRLLHALAWGERMLLIHCHHTTNRAAGLLL